MIRFRLSPDVLGTVQLALSPLAEVGASVRLLSSQRPPAVYRPWLRRVRAERAPLDLELLFAISSAERRPLAALYPSAETRDTTIDRQLDVLATRPAGPILDELIMIWAGCPRPPGLQRLVDAGPSAPRLMAAAIAHYWAVAIAPDWARMRAVLEDDVEYRSSRSAAGGLFSLLADLHPEITLDGHVLNIDKPQYPDAGYDGNQMTLVPSIFLWPTLILDHEVTAFELTYPARGIGRVWESPAARPARDALGALIGISRATILQLLAVPMSTTQVAGRLGQSPATVSRHLAILRDSGMVVSWRSGRSILYRRTQLATSMIGGQRRLDDDPAPATEPAAGRTEPASRARSLRAVRAEA